MGAYPENFYTFQYEGGSPVLIFGVTEIMCLKQLHTDTFLAQYKHGLNDFGTVFETGSESRMRFKGAINDYQPGNQRTVFADEPANLTQLDARTFDLWKVFVGSGKGVPDYQAKALNEIMKCD